MQVDFEMDMCTMTGKQMHYALSSFYQILMFLKQIANQVSSRVRSDPVTEK